MAQKPDIFGKWDFVKFFMQDPCDAPWSAYAISMAGATLEAFVLLYSLDISQIFWSAARAGLGKSRLRSGKKGSSGSKRRRFPRRSPWNKAWNYDPNDVIGNYGGKLSPLAKRPLPGALGILWLIFAIIEFANFVMFLAEVITQWFYRWTSLLWNSKYCQARDDAVVMRTNDPYTFASLFGETLFIAPYVLKQRGPITSANSLITIPNGWSGVITVSFNWVKTPTSPSNQEVTVRLTKLDSTLHFGPATSQTGPDQTPAGNGWQVSSGGQYAITIHLNQGFIIISDLIVYCHIRENVKKAPF